MMANLGYRPAALFAFFGGAVELVSGSLLAVGFLMPLVAAMIIGQTLNAAWTVHRDSGLWNSSGGYEYPLVLGAVAGALAFTGAGNYSLAAATGLEFTSNWWGGAAVVVGVAVGVLTLVSRTPQAGAAARERDSTQRAA